MTARMVSFSRPSVQTCFTDPTRLSGASTQVFFFFFLFLKLTSSRLRDDKSHARQPELFKSVPGAEDPISV